MSNKNTNLDKPQKSGDESEQPASPRPASIPDELINKVAGMSDRRDFKNVNFF